MRLFPVTASERTPSLRECLPSHWVVVVLLLVIVPLLPAGEAVKVLPRSCGGAIRHVHVSVGPDPTTSIIITFASIPSHYHPSPGAAFTGVLSPINWISSRGRILAIPPRRTILL